MMETAYVYGSKHQFILITGGPVLSHLGSVVLSFSLFWIMYQIVFHTGDRDQACHLFYTFHATLETKTKGNRSSEPPEEAYSPRTSLLLRLALQCR